MKYKKKKRKENKDKTEHRKLQKQGEKKVVKITGLIDALRTDQFEQRNQGRT